MEVKVTRERESAFRTPALDFVQLVAAKQRAELGLAVVLPSEEEAVLEDLLREAERGATPELERRVKLFLARYQDYEKSSPVLSDKERKRLNRIIRPQRSRKFRLTRRQALLLIAAAVIVVIALASVLTVRYVNAHQSGPPAGIANHQEPAQQVPPANFPLQDLKEDWKPWTNLDGVSDTRPQTGNPGLLLLETGTYSVSGWTVPVDSSAWQPDISGNVGAVRTQHGTYADITDSDGNPYIVGIDQPFIVSGNPGTLLKVDPTGNVFYMFLAKATAIRQKTEK